MLRINGLFGHIKHNDLMSILMFLGFMLALQLLACALLFVPLFFFDPSHSVLSLGGYITRYVPLVAIGGGVAFWVQFSAHVETVRNQMGFRYLERRDDTRLFTLVETLALAAGIQTPKIGLIETSARNAFACGYNQSNAVIVVTRGLRNALNDHELEAVLAHEMTHIVNNDIRLIAAANVMMSSLTKMSGKNPFILKSWWRFLFIPIFPLILIVSSGIQWLSQFALSLGKVSRLVIASSREYVADAEAIRLTHKPEALISALRRIENLSAIEGLDPENDAMMIDGASHGEYATHPTIFERIAAIEVLAGLTPSGVSHTTSSRADGLVRSNLAFGHMGQSNPVASNTQSDEDFWTGTYVAPSNSELIAQQSLFARVKQAPERRPKQNSGLGLMAAIGGGLLFFLMLNFSANAVFSRAEAQIEATETDTRNIGFVAPESDSQLPNGLRGRAYSDGQ
jgi:Zn-dependent protease with chaperone function